MGDTEIKTIFVTTEADVYRSDSRTMCGKRDIYTHKHIRTE